MNQGNDLSDITGIPNAHIRLVLDAPLREHATLAVEALKAELLHTPDREALLDAVEENNTVVAEAVEAGYPGTHDDFLELWRSHFTHYRTYLQATMADDETTKEAAKDSLEAFAGQTTSLLSDASPSLDPEDIEDAINTHTCHITTIIDELADEEYDDVYAATHEAFEHMGTTAGLLARYAPSKSADPLHL